MPQPNTTPRALRLFLFHGLPLDYSTGADDVYTECPSCGRSGGKFSVNVETGQYHCFVCDFKGNGPEFLRWLWKESDDQTSSYDDLATDRGLLYPETCLEWGLCRSTLTGEWLAPGYGTDDILHVLYRYSPDHAGKNRLKVTSECTHYPCWTEIPTAPHIKDCYITEGLWDGMTLWETLKCTKLEQGGFFSTDHFEATASRKDSLLAHSSVVSIPGGQVFKPEWAVLFSGKRVFILPHNDHPHAHPKTGKLLPPVGYSGAQKIVKALASAEQPPSEVHYLHWGDGDGVSGFTGFDPSLKHGYDVRDALTAEDNIVGRVRVLQELFTKFKPIPPDWVDGRSPTATAGGTDIELLPCNSWEELNNAWQHAMKWHDGLNKGLAVLLACVASTMEQEDQVWVKLIGPPSCGKTQLCEAISVNRKYVFARSGFTGFHSGFNLSRSSDEDNGMVPLIKGKTFVIKDGDTLLQQPNLPKILSEGRDLYDTTARVSYRTGVNYEHNNIRFTWIISGTKSLRKIDHSELGERFLDCVVMDDIDAELESSINTKRFYQLVANKGNEANCTAESNESEEKIYARQLTGGYINYLRENVHRLLKSVTVSDALCPTFDALAQFAAMMRARPAKDGTTEDQGREMSTRLHTQLFKLGVGLCVVLNKTSLDDEVLRRITQVALDTARGETLKIVRILHGEGKDGVDSGSLAVRISSTDEKTMSLLRFLAKIEVVERFRPMVSEFIKSTRFRWRLTPRMSALYEEVMSHA